MHAYELPLQTEPSPLPASAAHGSSASLPENLLAQNSIWFCRLRWLVVAILAAFGATRLFPEVLLRLGFQPPTTWPFAVAGLLALGNLAFLGHTRVLVRQGGASHAAVNLWCQIGFDLMVLTVVVHHLGSLETFAPFAYLFHVALACIFFSRNQSLLVMAAASVLYAVCVALEDYQLLPPSSLYADRTLREHIGLRPVVAGINVSSAIVIFAVVWSLTSHLSAMVRQRDLDLAEANERLLAAEREKARHMLHTTHELKAPFAAIHANAQLLLKGHCGELPNEALEVLLRITERCRKLALQIQEMLQLANLRSKDRYALPWTTLDLSEVLRWCLAQVQATAKEREVEIRSDIQPARTAGVEDHLKMLLSNLLSNAVIYSHRHGNVRLDCTAGENHGPQVVIEDHGIGVPEAKLPHIFEEYYRTEEAVRHNKESTGLGLAIVAHVCQSHRIRLRVESTPGAGTRFTLIFRGAEEVTEAKTERKEENNAVRADH